MLSFTWVDVFAAAPFSGNQLAVFQAPAGTPVLTMQQVTREMAHSETTFLQPAAVPDADFRLRIFIPTHPLAEEIPFAGHPVLGSACVAAMSGAGGAVGPATIRLETGVGVIPVLVEPAGPRAWEARMVQPLPRRVMVLGAGPPGLAEALGVEQADLQAALPVEAVDNGMQTVLIPLASVDAVRRARPDLPRLRALLGRAGLCTLIFAPRGVEPDSDVHCRVFSPFDLVAEDPATGSANGPLGEYMLRHGLAPGPLVRSEQGYEVGRPSRINITVERTGGAVSAVYVSGRVHLIGRGEFWAPAGEQGGRNSRCD